MVHASPTIRGIRPTNNKETQINRPANKHTSGPLLIIDIRFALFLPKLPSSNYHPSISPGTITTYSVLMSWVWDGVEIWKVSGTEMRSQYIYIYTIYLVCYFTTQWRIIHALIKAH
ncbi:predicted protein [Histoplasma capsulatum H143]|uniref:Uncharacterized protein n=1 Tax=Ajellomyces capsulatus (strain H143) TaxID=544712 RepID=C6HFI7_AJECH|nr:predicted protein [Histoplasma capsulatum H143]